MGRDIATRRPEREARPCNPVRAAAPPGGHSGPMASQAKTIAKPLSLGDSSFDVLRTNWTSM